MKAKILELLKNAEDYISGQDLCDRFGVSRTAIWKVMNQLKKEGYVITSVTNRGYKIVSYPDILSESEIISSLSLENVDYIKDVHFFEETTSTNTAAKAIADKSPYNFGLIVADKQISGKGRRGRSFVSPKGMGIFMTIYLKPPILPTAASMLTLLAGMAVSDSIFAITNLQSQIKWPNDIVVNGKKLCGILTEMSSEMDFINYVVIGIGINVNNDSFPEGISDVATSLNLETGKTFRRSTLIASVMKSFKSYYDVFLKTNDLSNLKETYNNRMINTGRKVLVIRGDEQYEAVAVSIDDDGELIVNRDGREEKVLSGEVSVRGVYGYV